MAMTEEERIRKLEEIVIKIEGFIEKMFTKQNDDHGASIQRISSLEKFKDAMTDQVHASCDLKTREIDKKIAAAMTKVWTALVILVGVFVGAVVYFNNADSQVYAAMNNSHTKIYDRISANNKPTIENTTNIKVILTTLNKIDEKLDDIHNDRHPSE